MLHINLHQGSACRHTSTPEGLVGMLEGSSSGMRYPAVPLVVLDYWQWPWTPHGQDRQRAFCELTRAETVISELMLSKASRSTWPKSSGPGSIPADKPASLAMQTVGTGTADELNEAQKAICSGPSHTQPCAYRVHPRRSTMSVTYVRSFACSRESLRSVRCRYHLRIEIQSNASSQTSRDPARPHTGARGPYWPPDCLESSRGHIPRQQTLQMASAPGAPLYRMLAAQTCAVAPIFTVSPREHC